MMWRVEFDPAAKRELDNLEGQVKRRIVRFLYDRVVQLDDPHSIGSVLVGPRFGEFWKYRVGDYRIVTRIEHEVVMILVVRIGHRREVYQR